MVKTPCKHWPSAGKQALRDRFGLPTYGSPNLINTATLLIMLVATDYCNIIAIYAHSTDGMIWSEQNMCTRTNADTTYFQRIHVTIQ